MRSGLRALDGQVSPVSSILSDADRICVAESWLNVVVAIPPVVSEEETARGP